MDMKMLACNSDKEQIVNDIKELKQKIILIEKNLQELRIFYITNKDKYDYELAETFFKNLQDFIEKERIKDVEDLQIKSFCPGDELYFIKYYTNFSRIIMNRYLDDTGLVNSASFKQEADRLFNIICDEEESKLLMKMFILNQKLKLYEKKLTELSPEPKCEKPVIENKQYSVSDSVIFLIMIVFYVITVVLLVNHNYNYNYNYTTAALYHPIQCSQNTRKFNLSYI